MQIVNPLGNFSFSGSHTSRSNWAILLCVATACLALLHSPANAKKIKSKRLMAPNHLVEIKITVAKKDWDRIRGISRSFADNFTDKPFKYVKGDISIDGVKIRSVGIRKKGFFGSMDSQRPSLKVKFDEYVKRSPIKGLSRLTLNNNKQDASQASQVLAYGLFNAAGLHAPRCNLARVTVNGKYLGIYSNVEAVKKPFLKRRFRDNSGNLYEGTIADLYPKAVEKIEAKTNRKSQNRSKLNRLATLLAAKGKLDLAEVEKLINIEHFLKFWAMESLIAYWDGYCNNQNNYFLYDNPRDGKLYFIPWGADHCFSSFHGPFGRFGGGGEFTTVYSKSMLSNRLYQTPGMPERYKRVMLGLLDKVWKEDKLLAELSRIEKLASRHLHERQRGAPRATDTMREFIKTRRENVLSELKQWPAPVLASPRKPSYTINVGSAKGTFAASWNDAPAANPLRSGKVSIELKLDGKAVKFKETGASAALAPTRGFGRFGRGNRQPQASIVLAGTPTNGERLTLTLSMNRSAFAASGGKSVAVRGSFSRGNSGGGGGFGGFNPRGGRSVIGTVKFGKVGTKAGHPVTGEFNVRIVESRGGMFGGGQAAMARPGAKKRGQRLKNALTLFKKFDANQDGKLQKTEWQKSGQSLEKADTNSDGKVSLGELINWFKKNSPKTK